VHLGESPNWEVRKGIAVLDDEGDGSPRTVVPAFFIVTSIYEYLPSGWCIFTSKALDIVYQFGFSCTGRTDNAGDNRLASSFSPEQSGFLLSNRHSKTENKVVLGFTPPTP